MAIDLHDQAAFIDAVTAGADRPIAFLVGSPLSWDKGGGVPGVTEMIDVAKSLVRAKLPRRLADFEQKLHGWVGADAYQAAMKWLHGSLTQSGVNEVIRQAVLKARNLSSAANFQGDGDPLDWYLPAGVRGLAALLTSGGDRFPGPVLTTNFDPLISLSIRDAGARRRLRVIDTDGALPTAVEADPGEIDVIHLHGYWHGANTLHTPAQLTSARPRLNASLRRLLLQRTLVVVAYSGWDDVFTQALVDVLQDAEAKVTVLWCFHESDAAQVEARYEKLLKRAQAAITSGALHLYGGVDCHNVFAEIANKLSAPSGPTGEQPLACPLPGWQWITPAFLSSLPPLKPTEAIRYFDGGSPSWRHVASNAIPRRSAFAKIASAWADLPDDQCSMQLIRAAGGEGKSTLLMQAAIEAAKDGTWEVLFRPSPQLGLSPDVVINLDESKQWLIVIDDADSLVDSLHECLRALHHSHRANVDFLLAARDTDWRAARGDGKPWSQICKRQPDVVLRGIDDDQEAHAIVEAWSAYGELGLRSLFKLENREAMVTALRQLVDAAQNDRKEGSLLGGLLDVRFSPQALRTHVREMMERLDRQTIRGSRQTLRDALVYVAACHGAGIPGIDGKVLADLLDVPRAWIGSLLVGPLGDEAAGSISGGHVFTRHRKVAEAILVEAELNLCVDLAEIWSELVKQTARTGNTIQVSQMHGAILHAGPRLQKLLSTDIPEQRRLEIALASSRAAIAVQPERLDHVTDLGRTFRAGGKFKDATDVFRNGLATAESKTDYQEAVRGYWYEWGVCEGLRDDVERDRHANAWLNCVSLSDTLNPAPIAMERVRLSCAGLGLAFGKLAQTSPDCPFALGRRAATWLGRIPPPDSKSHYFDKHDHDADEIGTPTPQNLAEAIGWLQNGASAAGQGLSSAWLTGLPKPEKLSFELFRSVLSPNQSK